MLRVIYNYKKYYVSNINNYTHKLIEDGVIKAKKGKERKLLSIDGGGIRGLFAITLLEKIEEYCDIKIADYFDDFIGVSTGSLIATLLYKGYTVKEIREKYKESMSRILKQENLNDLKDLEKELNDELSDLQLNDSKNLYVVYIDHKNKNGITYTYANNEDLINAIICSCSAPLYFVVDLENSKGIDGGFISRNPALIGYGELHKKYKTEDIKILSIGCIQSTNVDNSYILELLKKIPSDAVEQRANILYYLEYALEGMTNTTNSTLQNIFYNNKNNYLRLDLLVNQPVDTVVFDDVLKKSIDRLHKKFELEYYDQVKNFFIN